jgi:uncharacterized protein
MNYQRMVFARILPFAAYIIFLALDDELSSFFLSLHLDDKFSFLIRIFLVIAFLIYFRKDYVELKCKANPVDFLYAAISGVLVFIIWIFPYPSWLGASDYNGFNPYINTDTFSPTFWTIFRISGSALVIPIMEELFWRSYIMRWFDNADFLKISPDRISHYAYLGSACLFAVEHHLWLAGLFAGLVYGELYKVYKNLWVPIFAHAITNGLLGIWIVTTGSWSYW